MYNMFFFPGTATFLSINWTVNLHLKCVYYYSRLNNHEKLKTRSYLSQNIEIKVYISCLQLIVSTAELWATRSNDGHASYFAEVPHFLAPLPCLSPLKLTSKTFQLA